MQDAAWGSPYRKGSPEDKAWHRGYEDFVTGRPFHSGPSYQHASVTLAYNRGYTAAETKNAPR